MWLFHAKVALLRKKYDFIMKIEAHRDCSISGIRIGRVLADQEALSHPIPITTPPNVLVGFTVGRNGKQKERIESIHVSALGRKMHLQTKGTHVIIKGDMIGTLVTHLKSDGAYARVVVKGAVSALGFYIEKNHLCIVELSGACSLTFHGVVNVLTVICSRYCLKIELRLRTSVFFPSSSLFVVARSRRTRSQVLC